jgi:hypothetical protein
MEVISISSFLCHFPRPSYDFILFPIRVLFLVLFLYIHEAFPEIIDSSHIAPIKNAVGWNLISIQYRQLNRLKLFFMLQALEKFEDCIKVNVKLSVLK